jgi:glutamate synthase (NADPH/NADH) large chain
MVGQVDFIQQKTDASHWKFSKLDLSPILYKEPASKYYGLYKQAEQDHELENVLDWKLVEAAQPALRFQKKTFASFTVKNTNRTIGTLLSNEISKKYHSAGLPDDTIHFKFSGTAGQSFGAFNTKGITLELEGDANDYFGKGLSGAKLIIYPAAEAAFVPEENSIIGNVAFYGATSGSAYIRGIAGERFAVRNSGANAVVEGVGDHCCEYMTGGRIIILGDAGRNFAAGMSGGMAYLYNTKDNFEAVCNTEMVDLDPLQMEDIIELKKEMELHFQYTGSSVARFILSDFENQLKHFIKVFPKDYKRILQQKEQITQEQIQNNF